MIKTAKVTARRSKIKAIAFDCDGVLLESVEVKTRAFRRLFAQELPARLEQITAYHLQNGGVSRFEKFRFIYRDILKRPLPEPEFESLCGRFAQLVVDEVVVSPWVPGAREFLEKNRGKYHFFVVSATPDTEIKEIVKRRGIQNHFSAVLGSPRKKAELLKELMERFAFAADQLVYVGDAINDWQAARQHGIPFIWRRASTAIPPLPRYNGPCIASLETLEEVLS
jgi:phosphoglycolate phosphatase-like HAD superfamily hydrolase